jgi:hypothetical protein
MISKTDVAVEAVRPLLKDFRHSLNSLADKNPRLKAGAEALLELQAGLGNEAVIEFTRWAVHPSIGFLAQHQEINPLPENIKVVLDNFVRKLNTNAYLDSHGKFANRVPSKSGHSFSSSGNGGVDSALGMNEFFKAPFTVSYPSSNKFDIDRLTDHAAKALEALLIEKAQGTQR